MPQQNVPVGGAAIVKHLMAKKLFRALSVEQAEALWQECRAWLAAQGDADTVKAIESYCSTSIDTWDREGLMEAIARVMTGKAWPCNGDGNKAFDEFAENLKKAFADRGYVREPSEAPIPQERQDAQAVKVQCVNLTAEQRQLLSVSGQVEIPGVAAVQSVVKSEHVLASIQPVLEDWFNELGIDMPSSEAGRLARRMADAINTPLAEQQCNACGGMGMLDGVGERCPNCKGTGKQSFKASRI